VCVCECVCVLRVTVCRGFVLCVACQRVLLFCIVCCV